MVPISEFHYAFCGIATVAATLGYACARRAALSLTSSDGSSSADVEAGTPEERSLKRKLDDSDQDDVDAEEQCRPMKRNRTPPTDKHQSDEDEWVVIVPPPPYGQAVELRQPEEPVRDNATTEQVDTPAREPSPPLHPHPETPSQPDEKGAETGRSSTPQPPRVSQSPNEPGTPPAPPVTPLKPAVPANSNPTNPFSAFSGSSSPFTSYSNASGTSPFAPSGQTVKTTPAWRRNNKHEPDVFGQASSANALAPSPNDAVSSATTQSPALSQSKPTLSVSSEMKPLVKSSTYMTGEEDETVDAELKGVKLFTKRGRNEFTDGMYGHIKILTQKSTPPQPSSGDPQAAGAEITSRTRLLFRRDPLGQVSMNVGLHPTVRCHFDAAEYILRVILMEQVSTDEKNSKEDVVVYALKPGRAGKADFQSFAKMLCDHEGLKSTVVTSPVAAGDAAVS